MSYMDVMKDFNPTISKQFSYLRNEGEVKVGSVLFIVSMESIAIVNDLIVEGVTFPKKPKGNYKANIVRFLKPREKVTHIQSESNREDLFGVKNYTTLLLLKYITLDGRFKNFTLKYY